MNDDDTISLDEIRNSISAPGEVSPDDMITHEFEENEDVPNCPFCGETSEDALILLETGDHEFWYVHCDECLCNGPNALTREAAIDLWSMREDRQ